MLCWLTFYTLNNKFIFFSRTWLIKFLNYFFWNKNFTIHTLTTSTYWWTYSIYFSTSTIIIQTIFCTITTLVIYYFTIDFKSFFLKSFFINFLSIFNHKLTRFLIIFSIHTTITFTAFITFYQLFKTWTM